MPVLSTPTEVTPVITPLENGKEMWHEGVRAYIVMEVCRRIKPDEPSYKVRKGMAYLTVSHGELSMAK